MKDNQAKYPQLRFKGFTDPWEQRRLSEIVTEHNSGVYIAKDEYGSGTNIIGVGDIYESDLVDGQVFRLAPVKDEKFILHSRDLLYGESSLVQEGIARVVSVTDKGAGTAFAWHTRRFVVEPVVADSQFVMLELNYWFPAREHLMRTATKTALTGITTQDFFSTNILVPILLEQKKICDLVRRLDNLITVNQRKLAKLKELKQGYLQKLFPKNGAKVPELRFAGFADAWEQRKFKDILKTHSFRSYLAGVSENGDYEVIQQGDKPIFGYSDGEPFTDYKDVTLFGDHTVSLYKPKSPFFVATDGVKILSADNFEGDYLYTTLERYKPEPQGYKRHFTILKNQDVWFTENMEEQQKIGVFFKQLDDTITLHQRKLEKLQELKKGYLQKMFC